MSCVVGIKHQGQVWIGGDSCANDDWTHVLTQANAKVFRVGPMLVGHCWSPRTAQIIRYAFQPKAFEPGSDPMRYLVADFALPLRKTVEEHGALVDDMDDEELGDRFAIQMLIGLDGRLFRLESNCQVLEFDEEYDAWGSGGTLALGALHALPNDLDPEKRILIALEAAARWDPGVRPPFIIESI